MQRTQQRSNFSSEPSKLANPPTTFSTEQPPPSWDFRFSRDVSRPSTSKFRDSRSTVESFFSLKNVDVDSAENDSVDNEYVSVAQVTLRMDQVESEKSKLSNLSKNVFDVERQLSAKLNFDESSTDPIYSDGSTMSYGSTLILSDGLNNLVRFFNKIS